MNACVLLGGAVTFSQSMSMALHGPACCIALLSDAFVKALLDEVRRLALNVILNVYVECLNWRRSRSS